VSEQRLRDNPTVATGPGPIAASAGKAVPLGMPTERRHTVSLWLYLIGAIAFLSGCYLLFLEDGAQTRLTMPSLSPRTELPGSDLLPNAARADVRAPLPQVAATPTPVGVTPVGAAPIGASAVTADPRRTLTPEFLDGLWHDAELAGVRRQTFDRAFQGNTTLDPEIIALSTNQPEFDRTVGDYVGMIVNPDRIAVGRARLEQQSTILEAIEKRYGVDRHVLLAIWGIETNFGLAKGDRSVIRSLATLASAEPRRAAFWRSELVAALMFVEQEKIAPERLVGSWAGAMGHTQFMPSTLLKHGVDFDGDGVRDVWGSAPDALASAARYLQASGWVAGRAWGREVILPADFDFLLATPAGSRSLAAWRVLGVRPQTGVMPTVEDGTAWQLVVPSGAGGPAFLVSPNFDALLSYNRAYSYAVAVGALADRIAGNPSIQAAWPKGEPPLSRDQRIELQEILVSLGFDTGGVDGVLGLKSREAIRNFQKGKRLPADGYPSSGLLTRIRSERRL
jgi:membrane-bound lytic murein transglycosylase B